MNVMERHFFLANPEHRKDKDYPLSVFFLVFFFVSFLFTVIFVNKD